MSFSQILRIRSSRGGEAECRALRRVCNLLHPAGISLRPSPAPEAGWRVAKGAFRSRTNPMSPRDMRAMVNGHWQGGGRRSNLETVLGPKFAIERTQMPVWQ